MCCLALVLHRLLEQELQQHGVSASAEEIMTVLRGAKLQQVQVNAAERVYCKSGTAGLFTTIAQAVGLGTLPRIATALVVKKACKLRDL